MNFTTAKQDLKSPSNHSNQDSSDWQDAGYIAYATVMFTIISVGFLGNILSAIVLCQPFHRKQPLAPLMLNIVLGDLFLIVFAYPTLMQVVVRGKDLHAYKARCIFYAFVNGAVGLTSIATFTTMTIVLSYCTHQKIPRFRVSNVTIFHLLAACWSFGVILMLPPLLGWSRFVPGASGISCGPDWTDTSAAGRAYSLLLIILGFCGPIIAISGSYIKILRLIRRDIAIEDNRIKLRRRFWQMKLVRLTAIAITAFMLSWSPYSLASLISIFRGNSVLSAGEAEVPALMAKASVIYNPIVYTVMNRRFRRTLWNIILCITCKLLLLLCPEINRIKASKHRVTRTVTVTSPTQLSNFGEFLSSWRQNSS